MKKSILFFLTLILTASSFAQITQGINFQAIASDNSNNIVTEQNIGIRLSIIKESITGTVVYTETNQVTSDLNGVISLTIGQGNTSDDFNGIEWGSASHFLKTEMDIEGGSNYTNMGTIQFASVPYAKYAETAGNVKLSLSQVLTENNDAGVVQIKNLADPTDSKDAATKAYVDELIARVEALENGAIGNENIVTDIEGNVYPTVQIGTQEWIAEDLKTTKLNDGSDVEILNSPFYSVNTPSSICPVGWKIPSESDYLILIDYLGGDSIAGGKLKSINESWIQPNVNATNESGFNANANGDFNGSGGFTGDGISSKFLTTTTKQHAFFGMYPAYLQLNNNSGHAVIQSNYLQIAVSIRCIKD